MNYPIKIVGCIVDVHNITMYKADGDTLIIPQGDPRLKDLVAKLVPAIEANRYYMLQADDMNDRNHFAEAEKQMGGVVKFFKMLKSKAKELLDKFVEPIGVIEVGTKGEPVMVHTVNGVEPGPEDEDFPVEPAKPILPPEEERPLTRSESAVAEIMANAVPAVTTGFGVPDLEGQEETTILAVMPDNTVIPGCEALAMQATAMSEGVSSADGMQNFLRRAATMKRGHSVEDLLKFIQKGELPLADDGSVLVYKLLNSTDKEGVFVDCHSGNVKQRVGSFVHMAEKLVDPNRGQDCSNGLHVARRDYLKTFHGDVCVLAKLAPEDVIAVPRYDARKLRAKGYHIIAQLTGVDRDRVKNNQPMQDQVLLGNAIAGNHVGVLEYVEITEGYGGGLIVTPAEQVAKAEVVLDASLKGDSLDHLAPPEPGEAHNVDARALALELAKPENANDIGTVEYCKEVGIDLAEPGTTPAEAGVDVVSKTDVGIGNLPVAAAVPNTTRRPVDILVQNFRSSVGNPVANLADAQALLAFKKQSKKSWTALNISIEVWEKAVQVVDMDAAAAALPKAVPPNDDKLFPVAKVKKAAPPKPKVVKTQDKPAVKATPKVKSVDTTLKAPAPAKVPGKRSQKDEAAHLLDLYTKNPDYTNAKYLVQFKRASKKGWEALGVDAAVGKKLEARVKL